MAFIGKITREAVQKKPLVQFTFNPNINRISLIFRKGLIPVGSKIDVLVGTEEDAGYLKVNKGTGTEVSPIGKTGTVTSWGACRSVAAKVLPAMRRAEAKIIANNDEFMLLQVPLTPGAAVDTGLEPDEQDEPETASATDPSLAANLGL